MNWSTTLRIKQRALVLIAITAALYGRLASAETDCPIGNNNLCFGTTLHSFEEGAYNSVFGIDVMSNIASGSYNTAIGYRAISGNWINGPDFPLTGSYNTALGAYSMLFFESGDFNTATGYVAMAGGDNEEFMTLRGSNNTANGAYALYFIGSGSNNTAMGYRAMKSDNDPEAGETFVQGNNNTAIGNSALLSLRLGNNNTATGSFALASNFDGHYNTANGNNALRNLTAGTRNVAFGHRAGLNLITGSDNIIIGGDNAGIANESNVIRIGRAVSQKKAFVAGIRGVKTGRSDATAVMIDANGQLGTINSSRAVKEEIQSMGNVSERLLELRPVTFRYKQAYENGSKPVQFGLIAEEVAEVFPELVVRDSDGNAETVSYHLLSTLLVNELQKEHRVNESQAERIASLEAQVAEIDKLKSALAKMTQTIEQLHRATQLAAN